MDEDGLPLDPDVVEEAPAGTPRPVHLRLEYAALVFVGGSMGTLLRYLTSLAIPAIDGFPIGTIVINVVGAFVLGLLLVSLTGHGADHGMRRALRLLVGTGVLGGFTTYSAFAVDADGLISAAHTGAAALYALTTVVVGAAASLGGIALGFWIPWRRAGGRA